METTIAEVEELPGPEIDLAAASNNEVMIEACYMRDARRRLEQQLLNKEMLFPDPHPMVTVIQFTNDIAMRREQELDARRELVRRGVIKALWSTLTLPAYDEEEVCWMYETPAGKRAGGSPRSR